MIPLTPLSFLRRSSDVYASKAAVIDPAYPDVTYADLRARADRLSDALRDFGIVAGDRIAVLAPNGLVMLEAHYGVPGSGGVLVALNTRLSSQEYQYILEHCQARILIVDRSLVAMISQIVNDIPTLEAVVEIGSSAGSGSINYDQWVSQAPAGTGMVDPETEDALIAINYTSGTTGRPKGVMYTHRGAYLNSLGTALEFGLRPSSVYLWTLPMFHCNGWCYAWAVTAVGARHVCVDKPEPDLVLAAIAQRRVTHLCAAPVVLNSIVNHPAAQSTRFTHRVRIATGGAPPSPTTIARTESLGIELVHLYGMTETYGPSIICEPQDGWTLLSETERADKMARQGVRTITVDRVRVVDEHLVDVPRDAASVGEILVRSNSTMAGYFRDEEATRLAFVDGMLRTGDLAVMHPDGYIEIKDRAKDVIISGGENISSIEVEHALMRHPAVLEAAVVAIGDEKWGEVPLAFVVLRADAVASERELIDFVKSQIARFKAPQRVIFTDLPKTSTGKIQKVVLRERAREMADGG